MGTHANVQLDFNGKYFASNDLQSLTLYIEICQSYKNTRNTTALNTNWIYLCIVLCFIANKHLILHVIMARHCIWSHYIFIALIYPLDQVMAITKRARSLSDCVWELQKEVMSTLIKGYLLVNKCINCFAAL